MLTTTCTSEFTRTFTSVGFKIFYFMKQYTYFSAILTSVYLNTTIQLRHTTNFHFSDKGENGHRLCNNKHNSNTHFTKSRLEPYCKI